LLFILLFGLFRLFKGLFSSPEVRCPGKCTLATVDDIKLYSPLLFPGDLLTEKIQVKGTLYRVKHIVVLEVCSKDVLKIGVLQQVVLRKKQVLFIVSLHDAARNNFRFFQTVPCHALNIVPVEKLADYKPLIKRGNCFILHHHIPVSK
jgi:hypothetical protein